MQFMSVCGSVSSEDFASFRMSFPKTSNDLFWRLSEGEHTQEGHPKACSLMYVLCLFAVLHASESCDMFALPVKTFQTYLGAE